MRKSTCRSLLRHAITHTMNPLAAFFAAVWWNLRTFLHSGWGFVPWIRPHWRLHDMADQRGRVSPPPSS
jgi:hypothetical protein